MNGRWLEHYDPGVARAIGTYPEKTLADFTSEHARTDGTRTAIRFKGRSISFADLERESDAFAHALAAEGVKRGDRVALLLPNCPPFVIAALAAWKLGAIIAPQNPIYTERELEESLGTTAAEILIVLTPFYDKVKRLQPHTTLKRVIATNIKEYLPPLLRVLFTLLKEKKEGHRIALHPSDAWFQDLIAHGSRSGPRQSESRPDDPAVVLMSGGTTGTAKGVVSDHRSLVMAGVQLLDWLREPLQSGNGGIFLPLPLFHTYGCAGAQSMCLIQPTPLVLVPNPRDLTDLLHTIDRDQPTLLCGVPTLFTAMIEHPDVKKGKIDFSSVKACFSGAAPLMAETKRRFEEKTGARIVEGYSLTEATMACCANPYSGTNKTGSVGMPLPDVAIKIVDDQEGLRELPANETGEICLSAPQLMRGYWNNPAETAETVRLSPDGTMWLYTGDLGYLDEDGYVFVVDRKKDLIKTSGFQVWPREIEEVISSHPAVSEAGVAGLPDERKGEVVVAWVVKRPGMDVSGEELRTWCRDKLAPYKVPGRVEFRSELPKTMVGKVLRRVLVAEATGAAQA